MGQRLEGYSTPTCPDCTRLKRWVNGTTWVRGYHREEPGRFSPRVLLEELREALDRT